MIGAQNAILTYWSPACVMEMVMHPCYMELGAAKGEWHFIYFFILTHSLLDCLGSEPQGLS